MLPAKPCGGTKPHRVMPVFATGQGKKGAGKKPEMVREKE
jgi:hypothetical protein